MGKEDKGEEGHRGAGIAAGQGGDGSEGAGEAGFSQRRPAVAGARRPEIAQRGGKPTGKLALRGHLGIAPGAGGQERRGSGAEGGAGEGTESDEAGGASVSEGTRGLAISGRTGAKRSWDGEEAEGRGRGPGWARRGRLER